MQTLLDQSKTSKVAGNLLRGLRNMLEFKQEKPIFTFYSQSQIYGQNKTKISAEDLKNCSENKSCAEVSRSANSIGTLQLTLPFILSFANFFKIEK